MKKNLFLLICISVVVSQCYYDQEGILYPSSCTPSDAPSFTADVLPVLEARCNNCHSGTYPSGNISLDTYNDVKTYITDGSLMGSIKQTGSYSPMPKNSSKLSACEINKIQAWIDAGTPE